MLTRFRLAHAAVILLLFGLALLPYLSVLGYGFLEFDDGIHIYHNPLLQPVRWTSFWKFFAQPLSGLYVPVTYSVWGVTAFFSQLLRGNSVDPLFFHGVNLLLHGLNVVLVYLLLRVWNFHWPAAFIGSLLFAWHPLHVEPVAWVSGTKDLLSSFFVLMSVLCNSLQERKSHFQPAWKWSSLMAFVFSLASKPSAVIVAPLLWVREVLINKRHMSSALSRTSLYWILACISIVYSKQGQPDAWLSFNPNLGQRLLIAIDSLAFYLKKLILPFPLTLNYGRTPLQVLQSEKGLFDVLPVVFLVCLTVGIVLLPRWRAKLAFPFSLFLVSVLPTSGLVLFYYQRFSTVADRFAYLSLIGVSFGVALLAQGKSRYPIVKYSLLGLTLVLCARTSLLQVRHWKDDVTVLRNMVSINHKAENHYNLAQALTEELEGRIHSPPAKGAPVAKPKVGEARVLLLSQIEQHYLTAVRLDAQYFQAYNNLGILKAASGDWKSAEYYYSKAIALAPDKADSYNNLGVSLAARGQLESAYDYFVKTITVAPQYGEAHYNLGLIFVERGMWKAARESYARAVALKPTNHRYVAGLTLANQKLSEAQSGAQP